MSDFVKLYGSILDSSVWGTSKDTRLLWVTMLAMADRHGVVEASVGGLARRAGLTREECLASLEVLSSPDEDDKSGVDEGRRVRKIERGWHITNHAAYRELRTEVQEKGAERVRRHRERGREREREREREVSGDRGTVTVTSVTPGNAPSHPVRADRDREADQDQKTPPPKDLTGSARAEPVSEVVVISSAQVPCPADLTLTDGQRSALKIGSGMTDYQIDQLTVRFCAAATANSDDRRPLDAWRKCLAKAVASDFSNPRRRPPRSADSPETDEQARERLRRGPRQPNALDHSTHEAHLRAIGATEE